MPSLSCMNRASIDALEANYHALSSFKSRFFPSKIKSALIAFRTSDDEATSAARICSAYLYDTWFFQRWCFSCLSSFSQSSLMQSYKIGASKIKEKGSHTTGGPVPVLPSQPSGDDGNGFARLLLRGVKEFFFLITGYRLISTILHLKKNGSSAKKTVA